MQNVGTALWRIGSPALSTGLYIEAPNNLALKPEGQPYTHFSAQNDELRVDLKRGTLRDFDALKTDVFGQIGANPTQAKPITLIQYEGLRLENEGKIGFVVKYGNETWGIAILPQTAPTAKAAVLKSANSLWFERREAPDWKDRAIGSTSFQADLPFELAPRPTSDEDTVTRSARWRNFWVDAIEWRSGRTDLEGTIKLQIEELKKEPALTDVRVKQIDRRYSWGFLENGERGQFVQIDYTEGDSPRRIYKIFSVAGTRVVLIQLSLNPKDPVHLLAAHRILGTARLGWTDSNNFAPQKITQENFEIDSDSAYKQVSTQSMRVYQGGDPLTFVFVLQPDKAILPDTKEISDAAQTLIELGVKGVIEGAGGKITNSRLETLNAGLFPARRLVFEAEINKHPVNGDAAFIFTGNKIIFPLRLVTTASSDFARRWDSTYRGASQTPGNWPKRTFAGIEIVAPTDAQLSADGNQLSGSGDGISFKITSSAQSYEGAPNFNPGPNETSPITTEEIEDALGVRSWQAQNAIEKAAKAAGVTQTQSLTQPVFAGNTFGMAGWYAAADPKFPRLDVIALHDGTKLWTLELSWNPADAKSVQARDALLNSIGTPN